MIRWEAPGPYQVWFSTRSGGVSEGPFSSLNLAKRSADLPERVEENRRRLCAAAGADVERLAFNRQCHSATVLHAEPGARGEPGDGLWTDAPGLPLLSFSADCVPLALARVGSDRPALTLLHAGWRGLLEGIVEQGVHALGGGSLAAAIGPAIGPCCYEVGEDVAARFRSRFGRDLVRAGKLDLWTAAERALQAAGVGSVERVDLCTACHAELFFSYRRDGPVHGAQGVIGFVEG